MWLVEGGVKHSRLWVGLNAQGARCGAVWGTGAWARVHSRSEPAPPSSPQRPPPSPLTCGAEAKVVLAASMPIRLGGLCSGARSEAFSIVARTSSLRAVSTRTGGGWIRPTASGGSRLTPSIRVADAWHACCGGQCQGTACTLRPIATHV